MQLQCDLLNMQHIIGKSMLDSEIQKVMLEAREKGLSIKARYSKVLFCGSSGTGKSNFIRLLLKKKFKDRHIPTGVTKSHQLLAKQITLTQSQDKTCKLEDLSLTNQVKWLKWFLKNKKYYDNNKTEIRDACENQPENVPDFQSTEEVAQINENQPLNPLRIEDMIAKPDPELPTGNPPDVWNLLTFLDTGGQPAFLNMLPTVNSSAMITFVIHSMENGVQGLKNKVTVRGDGSREYSAKRITDI